METAQVICDCVVVVHADDKMRMLRCLKAWVTLLAFASFSGREIQAQDMACEHKECVRVCFTEYEPFIFKKPAEKPRKDTDGPGVAAVTNSSTNGEPDLTLLKFYEQYAGFDVELVVALAL